MGLPRVLDPAGEMAVVTSPETSQASRRIFLFERLSEPVEEMGDDRKPRFGGWVYRSAELRLLVP